MKSIKFIILLMILSLVGCSSENEENKDDRTDYYLNLRSNINFSYMKVEEANIVIEALQRIGSVGYESEIVPKNLGMSQELYNRLVDYYFKKAKSRSDNDYISYGTADSDCVAHSIYRLLKHSVSLNLIKQVIRYETFDSNGVPSYFLDKIMAKFFIFEKYKPSIMGEHYEQITDKGRSKGIIGILKDKEGNAHSVTVESILSVPVLEKSGYVIHYQVYFRDDQNADDSDSEQYSGLEPIENFCAFYNVTDYTEYDGSL